MRCKGDALDECGVGIVDVDVAEVFEAMKHGASHDYVLSLSLSACVCLYDVCKCFWGVGVNSLLWMRSVSEWRCNRRAWTEEQMPYICSFVMHLLTRIVLIRNPLL